MNIKELQTPATLLDLDVLEKNLKDVQDACKKKGKALWPMIKTHKSRALAQLQLAQGAEGFLCGTLDECDSLAGMGVENIMYAYPLAGAANIQRVVEMAEVCQVFLRLDHPEQAPPLEAAAGKADVVLYYTLIIDSGLHRFGLPPEEAVACIQALKKYDHLVYKGISTHPGQVYACKNAQEIQACVEAETQALSEAARLLTAAGFPPEMITSGSTPTLRGSLEKGTVEIFHPGNYVFNDGIQCANGTAQISECALTVLATIIAHPSQDYFICDAGSKCLGLDQGAHSQEGLQGYGLVKGHPELKLVSLSEEVGKLEVQGQTSLRIGDQIQIIPNHACSAANLTSYLIGHRQGNIQEWLEVDMRSNRTMKIE